MSSRKGLRSSSSRAIISSSSFAQIGNASALSFSECFSRLWKYGFSEKFRKPSMSMFATYRIGFRVRSSREEKYSSSTMLEVSKVLAEFALSRCSWRRSSMSNLVFSVLSPLSATFSLSIWRSRYSRSERTSSVSTIEMSRRGSVLPSTWVISVLSKHLTTWIMASTDLIWPKNLFPNPSPREAP